MRCATGRYTGRGGVSVFLIDQGKHSFTSTLVQRAEALDHVDFLITERIVIGVLLHAVHNVIKRAVQHLADRHDVAKLGGFTNTRQNFGKRAARDACALGKLVIRHFFLVFDLLDTLDIIHDAPRVSVFDIILAQFSVFVKRFCKNS